MVWRNVLWPIGLQTSGSSDSSTDNGPHFASKFLQQVSAVMGVHQIFTSAYHPATNCPVDRFNRTVLAMLSHYAGARTDLDKVLGPTMAAYNSTVHSSTGFAPHEFVSTTATRVLNSPPNPCPLRDKGEWRREFLQRSAAIGACSAKTTKPPYSSLSILVVVLLHLIVRSETALVA
jgi:hypothetical protein